MTISTIHGVKGAEFDAVIAYALLEDMVPHFNDPNGQESAMKLLYVIGSRARKNLTSFLNESSSPVVSGEEYQVTRKLASCSFGSIKSIEITSSATALSMGCPTALFSVWLNRLRAARSACPAVASSTCKRSAQARITVSGRGGLANASPVRDERIANVEQPLIHKAGDAARFCRLTIWT